MAQITMIANRRVSTKAQRSARSPQAPLNFGRSRRACRAIAAQRTDGQEGLVARLATGLVALTASLSLVRGSLHIACLGVVDGHQ